MKTLAEVKEKYTEVYDLVCLHKANGDLATLCNERSKFDETFDSFFDSKREKYETDLYLSNNEMEGMLDEEDEKELIEFYEIYIEELEEAL